jgi:transposase-like protein
MCPHCGNADSDRVYSIEANPEKNIRAGLYECAECGKQFTVTVGTIFERTKIPLRKWLVAWYLLCSSKKGISAAQLQRNLGLGSYRTAWHMLHRIRYALRDPVFQDKLGGRNGGGFVEADETWIGGKAKGKGRGYTDNKTAVMSVVERGGRVRSTAIGKVTGENLREVLDGQVHPQATLVTDEHAGYIAPGRDFRSHETVNHSRREYVRGEVHTNTVEGFFANLKRGIGGIYHHVGSHYLAQYLGEFDFRYNTRHLTDGQRTVVGLQRAEGKRLMLRRSSPTPV